ncbi:variable membrane protein precursor [Reticulomyxa filosa]|uniref:Variable membrane protein n=1 Tax=Reticulomyxa filosa TaxID=46433 RepID=X6NT30_RETFI|nr:variable membrane protein precursor [Reticulomyxa filosa]|eukprot:ETO28462.1 variable membrane protein precursor [Reticulomyxa filosa]
MCRRLCEILNNVTDEIEKQLTDLQRPWQSRHKSDIDTKEDRKGDQCWSVDQCCKNPWQTLQAIYKGQDETASKSKCKNKIGDKNKHKNEHEKTKEETKEKKEEEEDDDNDDDEKEIDWTDESLENLGLGPRKDSYRMYNSLHRRYITLTRFGTEKDSSSPNSNTKANTHTHMDTTNINMTNTNTKMSMRDPIGTRSICSGGGGGGGMGLESGLHFEHQSKRNQRKLHELGQEKHHGDCFQYKDGSCVHCTRKEHLYPHKSCLRGQTIPQIAFVSIFIIIIIIFFFFCIL